MWSIKKVDSRQHVYVVTFISELGQTKTEIKKTTEDIDDRLAKLNIMFS